MTTKNVLAVLIASVLVCGFASAQEGDSGHRDVGRHGPGAPPFPMADPERMIEHMSEQLQLDETQKQELRNAVSAARPQLEALRDREMANRMALQALDTADPDYGVKVQDIAIDNGQIATELTLAMSALRVDIHSKLTPEQQKMLSESLDGRHERGREHHRRPRNDGT